MLTAHTKATDCATALWKQLIYHKRAAVGMMMVVLMSGAPGGGAAGFRKRTGAYDKSNWQLQMKCWKRELNTQRNN